MNWTTPLFPIDAIIGVAFLFVLCIFLLAFIKKADGKGAKAAPGKGMSARLQAQGDAWQRKPFMTDSERQFLRALEVHALPLGLRVCPQVRLCDIVTVSARYKSRSREYNALFRQISQWHCDFVLVRHDDFTVLAVIELDDLSHHRPDRRRRDAIFDDVLKTAGIPCWRVCRPNEFLATAPAWLQELGV
ncbi:DUF2726 domain-containing protein [Serratia marcescens]|uniref:DUF2726 domain-containing protein n=1 Tax=Serratia marcescens TaxID=615 RepID=UPI0015D88CD3|nr:DUF2726 domain-containing protein [Serratia marcescens]MBL5824283.1 DUF2726 domain-containing protein [Serratia marcescens]QLJ63708.1 DUF2726 domain-containing protein [Serratia marcescens]